MIEGGGSRNYIHTKNTLMYRQPAAWRMLLDKLILVLREYAAQQETPVPTSSRSSTAGPER